MSKLGDELLVLIGREDPGDYIRVTELVDELYRSNKNGSDFEALKESKPYIRKMQQLLPKGQN